MATFLDSQMGGKKLSYQGHLYRKNRNGENYIYWRCELHKSIKCPGTAKTTSIENGAAVEVGKLVATTKWTPSDFFVQRLTSSNIAEWILYQKMKMKRMRKKKDFQMDRLNFKLIFFYLTIVKLLYYYDFFFHVFFGIKKDELKIKLKIS